MWLTIGVWKDGQDESQVDSLWEVVLEIYCR